MPYVTLLFLAVLRGAGQQAVGAMTNIFSFYVLGLPCAWLLCFNGKFRVPGLLVGISTGTACQVASLSFLIYWRPDYIFRSQIKSEGEDGNGDGNIAGASAGGGREGAKHRISSDMDSSTAPLTLTDTDEGDITDMDGNSNSDSGLSSAASSYSKSNIQEHADVSVRVDADADEDEEDFQTVSFTCLESDLSYSGDDIDALKT